MNTQKKMYTLTLSAILIAIGTVIPLFMPKVIIGPMSFTLASHVAIMIAIFISPSVAVSVTLGTTLGFFLAGFPFIVVLRALSHIVWALAGALYIQKHPDTFQSFQKSILFSCTLAFIHALGEMLVVLPFYWSAGMDIQSFSYMLFGLVGLGTFIHSSVDFGLSLSVWKVLSQNSSLVKVSNVKKIEFVKNT